jgi:hypothetical protein
MAKKSFRHKMESIVFAGLKPGAPASQSTRVRWLGPLRDAMERLVSGSGSNDPLYLTNRTWLQHIRLWVLLAVPCLAVVGVIAFFMFGNVQRRDPAPKQTTKAELAARMLPEIPAGSNPDLEIMEVRIDPDTSVMEGRVRNRSSRRIGHADVIFDLADQHGSRLGAVDAIIDGVAPGAIVSFRQPIAQHAASVAIVREVRTQ